MSQVLKYKEVFGKILESKLPFVLYKKPEEEDVYGFIQKDVNIWFVQDFEKDQGFVFSPYEGEEEKILLKSDARLTFEMDDLDISTAYKGMNVQGLFNDSVVAPDTEADKQKHINVVNKAIDSLKKGEIDKVVLTRAELWKAGKVNFSAIYRDLVNTYDDAFVYIWFHPMVGMWIGATPELLIEKDDNYIHSTAIAGTRKYNNAEDSVIEWGSKELQEQKIVSDYIVEVFEKNLMTSIREFGPETIHAGKVEHLKTDITGEMSESTNFNYLIGSLHPTPAVGGVPLKKAKQFIKDNEGHRRDFYTGFLGELNIDNHTELYVNLRCLQVVRDGVKFFVGGGITEDSLAESEWEETVNKSNTLKDIVLNHLS
ncbi:MAG: chorismate-binding protein [Bacteroidota bacterium]